MERRTERINMKILPSLKALAEEEATAEGRTLSNYIENLIKKGDSKMIVRKNDMVIIEEGIDWTIYLGEYPCSNGRIEDVAEVAEYIGKRLDSGEPVENILKDLFEFR